MLLLRIYFLTLSTGPEIMNFEIVKFCCYLLWYFVVVVVVFLSFYGVFMGPILYRNGLHRQSLLEADILNMPQLPSLTTLRPNTLFNTGSQRKAYFHSP